MNGNMTVKVTHHGYGECIAELGRCFVCKAAHSTLAVRYVSDTCRGQPRLQKIRHYTSGSSLNRRKMLKVSPLAGAAERRDLWVLMALHDLQLPKPGVGSPLASQWLNPASRCCLNPTFLLHDYLLN
jgi:hypothetical protein